jgi:hypothetical protein
MKKHNCRFNRGEGLVVVIIMLAIVGGGILWLYSHKKALDRDARAFGRETINALAVKHDAQFFANNLGPQARLENPPSQQQYIIQQLTERGVPQQPIQIEEQVTFESGFFEPRGFFTAHLLYPRGPATMQIAISHPVGKWQLDNFTFTSERPPH